MCSTSITSFILKGLFMKIRKGLLAAATAATVSFSGVVAAPAFAETNNEPTPVVNEDTEKGNNNDTAEEEPTFGEKLKANSSDKDGNWDPKLIISWIGVFTAVLSAIGTVLTFVQKNFDVKF